MTQAEPPKSKTKDELKAIRILFGTLVAGVVLFAVVMLVIVQLNGPSMKSIDGTTKQIFLGVSVAAGVGGIAGARSMFRKVMTEGDKPFSSLPEKLGQYRGALIIFMALCEGPALLSIILFFLTGNYMVLIVTAAMLLLMLTKIPTNNNISKELLLDWQEQQELE